MQVSYINDGKEERYDSIVFDIEFRSTSGYTLPEPLLVRKRINLEIKIKAVNDIPRINMADGGNSLKIALGTKMRLNSDVLTLHDPDSNPSDIIVSLNPGSQEIGHFEIDRYPNKRKMSFTASNFNAGHVYYVHDSKEDAEIELTVSDNRDIGNSLVLHVQPFQLQIYVVNNTGLTVAAGSTELLTSYNLTFTTNAPEQGLNLR